MQHRIYQITLACALLLSSAPAFAQPQIRDHWSRAPVSSPLVQQQDAVFRQLYESTVRVNDATGVYLGVYAGLPVLMTAHHVMPDQDACTGHDVAFYEVAAKKGG